MNVCGVHVIWMCHVVIVMTIIIHSHLHSCNVHWMRISDLAGSGKTSGEFQTGQLPEFYFFKLYLGCRQARLWVKAGSRTKNVPHREHRQANSEIY